MKIDPTGPGDPKAAWRKRKTEKSGVGEFSGTLDAELQSSSGSDSAPAATGVEPITPPAPVLATQEIEDDKSERSRARSRGLAILDHLDRLREAILLGDVSAQVLTDIAQLTHAQREAINDPRLHEILDEIELRAGVELAKHSR